MRWNAALLLAPLLVAACGSSSSNPASGPKDIVLAVVGPMTGDAAADGQHILQGARMAADEINANGGIQRGAYKGARLVIQPFDDRENVQQSVSIARQVVSDQRYWAFLGTGFSDAALATAPVLDRASVSYLSTYASSQKIVEKKRHNVFVVPPTFPAYAYSAAARARALGFSRAAIFEANAGFALQMADLFRARFQQLGGSVVDEERYELGDKNTEGLVAHAKAADPDVVVMAGLTGDDASQLQQLRQAGVNVPVLDVEAVLFSRSFLDIAGPLAEGVLGQTPSDPQRNTPAARHLRDLYRQRYGTEIVPDPTAFTYEAVLAVAKALEAGPVDRTHLADALHAVDIPDTGLGELHFDADGARLGGVLWYFHVHAGQFVFDTGYKQVAPFEVQEVPLEH
jgi:branched-chain amino acid transport system substrate-binding protein